VSAAAAITRTPVRLAISDPRERGEAILFVHGFSHNHSVWHEVEASLPERWRPVSVDLRGHGESDWSPAGEYDLPDYASDLSGCLDALGIARAHVVGHSLGGNVCTLFCAEHPDRVRSLTLVDTGPSLAIEGAAHVLGEVGDAFRSYPSIEAFRTQLSRLHPVGEGALLDRLARASLVRRLDGRYEPALDPGVLGEGLGPVDSRAARTMEETLWQALRALECPVLVLRGGLSSILSEEVAHRMVDAELAAGRLETLPRAGHAIMIDEPAGLGRQLVDFLDAVVEASAPSAR